MTVDPNIAADPNGTGQDAGNSSADPNGQVDPNAGQQAPAPIPAPKTYTEQQYNAQLAQMRRTQEAEYKRNVERIRQEYAHLSQPKPAAPTAEQPLFEEPIEKALDAFFTQRINSTLAPVREKLEAAELQGAIARGRNQYQDFAANENDILATMVSFGESVVNSAPLEWLIDQAYRAWKFGSFDEKKVGDSAVKAYLASAKARAATPTPAGPGGSAPAGAATDFGKKSWDDVSKAGLAEFERVRRASAGV